MPSNKTLPWDSWDVELPKAGEVKDYSEYDLFHDEKFISTMHSEIRANVMKRLKKELPSGSQAHGGVLLFGGEEKDFEFYDSDTVTTTFRQEAFFRYLFPVNEPNCYGLIDLATGHSVLFVPNVSEESKRWNGEQRECSYYVKRYGVSHCHTTDELESVLRQRKMTHLFVLKGMNHDSGMQTKTTASFKTIKNYKVDEALLYPLLEECRVIKTDKELKMMRLGTLVSSQAHVYVMRHAKTGMTEMQLEALFKAWTNYFGGTRHMAYTCICACGPHGSILHYGHAGRPNERTLENGDFACLDMGAEYNGYATDLTRSYPINGVFTEDQKNVFNAVRDAQEHVFKAMKPGVNWYDMHRLSEKVILTHLLRMGVLQNATVQQLIDAKMASVFMPHGLGHLIGLYVHDVGGFPKGVTREKEPGVCWLRCGRKLEKGMVITVEPGIYFNMSWINKALKDKTQGKYINKSVLKRFENFGGCRLEDDVAVTANGIENFSVMPSSVQDIEQVMKQANARKTTGNVKNQPIQSPKQKKISNGSAGPSQKRQKR